MKKIVLLVIIILIQILSTSCSNDDARAVLDDYLKNVKDGDYEKRYDFLSKYDQGNISKCVYIQWREVISKLIQIDGYSIGDKSDKFKDMEQFGIVYSESYGFDVNLKIKKLNDEIKIEDMYEPENYKQMLIYEDDSRKIGLFYEGLEAR